MPLYVRPFLYFIYRFIFRLGFLDGKEGMLFHFLQAFWYRLLVDIKIDELQNRRGVEAGECQKVRPVERCSPKRTKEETLTQA